MIIVQATWLRFTEQRLVSQQVSFTAVYVYKPGEISQLKPPQLTHFENREEPTWPV